jgi:two-component system phosphate regulon sensor histidine kinase PhoR
MDTGWWVAVLLLIVVVAQFFVGRRLKQRLRQEINETTRLERKLSAVRQDLADINARRKKLLTASTQALIIVEADGVISSANKVAKRLFGKPGKNATLMSWTRHHQLYELVNQTLQGDKMPPLYFNSGDKILEAHARNIKENKQIVAVALAIHDVTELQRLARARRYFITNISHELRTPLASLQLLTETLLNGALEDEEMAPNLVAKIAIQVGILKQLAQEVLDLALIESGKTPLRMAVYPLRDIAELQVETLLPQAEHKNLAVRVNIPDDIKVLVDENMVGRVITNLVHNAIKFTETGGITLSAEKANGHLLPGKEKIEEDWVVVSVSDTGPGIPTEELPRIFERFYKLDQARTKPNSGTGLGLAIAKHIVEAHGGQIWAESNSSVGATFYFTVPSEEIAK